MQRKRFVHMDRQESSKNQGTTGCNLIIEN